MVCHAMAELGGIGSAEESRARLQQIQHYTARYWEVQTWAIDVTGLADYSARILAPIVRCEYEKAL